MRNWSKFSKLILALTLLLTGCVQPQEGIIPTETLFPAPAQKLPSVTPAVLLSGTIEPEAGGSSIDSKVAKTPGPLNADIEISPTPENIVTMNPGARKLPKNWPEWPLIPEVHAVAKKIYRTGLEKGNDIHSFSTIGDCQSEPPVFMGIYDSDHYQLGEGYDYLEGTIENFEGSFNRDSITVADGLSVATVLSPMWADPDRCLTNETPLACELRLHRPIIMFINLGTNWKSGNDATHEKYMRQVVDILIANGVVPVLSTKGDNQEGTQRINQSIARVAYDYDVPLWNFWRAIRDLPGKGIDGTREGGYLAIEAWGPRSFTGLLALDAVWRELKE